jgi:mannose-6-phosphate isomerase-like protein (cupin superfamily)
MRRSLAVIIAAYVFAGAGQFHPRSDEQVSTVISRRQIEQTLKQKLPGAADEFGGGLLDGSNYRIGALQRAAPGEVEVHQNDTDILYMISGTATLVTGGELVGRRAISATETRGTSIRNGMQHELSQGDVVVVPKQQPHWFQNVSGAISYIVIKVQ